MSATTDIVANSDLLTPVLNSVINIGLHYNVVASPTVKWSNDYEMAYTGVLPTGVVTAQPLDFVDLANVFQAWALPLLAPAFQLEKITFSTWTRDSKPYNPNVSKTHNYPLGTVGTRTVSGDTLPLDQAFRVIREMPVGRNGNVFLRGMLAEADVLAPAGRIEVGNVAGFALIISTAQAANAPANAAGETYNLNSFQENKGTAGTDNNGYGYYLCSTTILNKKTTPHPVYRLVQNFSAFNATNAKLGKKWYKRAG